jgi:hypothetical protein
MKKPRMMVFLTGIVLLLASIAMLPVADAFLIVKTDIPVRLDSGLQCGDDLIAFGTDTSKGVSYIIPSEAPTSGTPVTDSDLYSSKGFAVGGQTIFLAGSNTGSLMFQVSVFDVPTATITKTYTDEEIRLARIPAAIDDKGHIQADGDYCVVICDQGSVTDGKIIKVIDVSGAEPVLIAFDENPASTGFGVDQVAVDAATKTVVVVADDIFYIYDIDDPTAAPTQITAPNGVGDYVIQISGNNIIALDDQNYEEAFLVDLSTSSIAALTDSLATGNPAIGGTTFAFFADADANDSSGGSLRTAVGTFPGPGFGKAPLDNPIDGSTSNNGYVGFAGDMCVTPSGSHVFLSDSYLQHSTGTALFTVPPDPEGSDPYACPAWDVDCSSDTVAFKTASDRSDSDKTIGYIIVSADTTTTTTVDSTITTTTGSNTTTTIADQTCPSEEIYGAHSEEAELLRYFRDSVLRQTPEGQEIIHLYYQWSPVIVNAMKADKEFQAEIKELIDGILPLIGGGK